MRIPSLARLILLAALVFPWPALAQTTVVSAGPSDPCAAPLIAKTTVPIGVATATTTQLVAPDGTTKVYVCGGAISIAPSATSADTALFEYGTSTACTGTHALTGTLGNGDLTSAAPPIVVPLAGLVTPPSQGLCIVTAGTAVSVQGFLTYVQQ